jgi:hypothetical protein
MPACVIGLTAYEEEYRTQLAFYAENLFSIERFDVNGEEWLNNIVRRIRFLYRWKSAYRRALSFDFEYDLVILTARYETEFKPILDSIEWASGPSDDWSLFKDRKLKAGTVWLGNHLCRVAVSFVSRKWGYRRRQEQRRS